MSGKRYACHDVLRRVSEGPPVSPALHAALGPRSRAAKDSRGIPTITADLKPACRRKVGGTQSLPAAHESLATRVLDPTLNTAEGAGGGGGGLGKPVVVRRARRTGNRQAGGGPDSPIGFPKAPPAPPARWIGGDWVATVSNWDTTERTEGASSKV